MMMTAKRRNAYVLQLPAPEDLSNKTYPSDERERYNQSIDDWSALVAYMLHRAGFPYVDAVNSGKDWSLEWAIWHAWNDLEAYRPGSALSFLVYALELLGESVPRWWLDQLSYVPMDESYEPDDFSWWPEDKVAIDEDELPPWEVSQTTA